MEEKIKIFVTLYYRDWLFNTEQTYLVESEEGAHEMALREKKCYGYYLNYYVYGGEPMARKRVIFGNVYTLEQIRSMDKVRLVLLSMWLNHYKKAAKTRCGNWVEWRENVEYISV